MSRGIFVIDSEKIVVRGLVAVLCLFVFLIIATLACSIFSSVIALFTSFCFNIPYYFAFPRIFGILVCLDTILTVRGIEQGYYEFEYKNKEFVLTVHKHSEV